MGEIKFRAWDKKNNIMAYPNDDGEYSFIDDEGERVRSDQDLFSIISGLYKDITPMQFTGLKDKNKKEIYEGDIVKCHDYPTGVADCITFVRFENGIFGTEAHGWPLGDYGSEWIEVLGNIYENPELLSEQNQNKNVNY